MVLRLQLERLGALDKQFRKASGTLDKQVHKASVVSTVSQDLLGRLEGKETRVHKAHLEVRA